MASDRAGGLKRTSCGIVLIGQDPLIKKQIAFVLRVAGFRVSTSMRDADLVFLQDVACEYQTVSIVEVNRSYEETSRHLTYSRTLYPMGWFPDGETSEGRYSTPKGGQRSARAGKDVDGVSEKTASSRAATPVADAVERGPTDRQAMILKSLVNGDSNKVVARKLRIAEETVKVHMKRLLRRIGVKNRTQAAIWAMNNNFAPAVGETGDLRRSRAFTQPRPGRRSAVPKSEFGVPPEPQLTRARGGEVKGRGKTIRKYVAKYH